MTGLDSTRVLLKAVRCRQELGKLPKKTNDEWINT